MSGFLGAALVGGCWTAPLALLLGAVSGAGRAAAASPPPPLRTARLLAAGQPVTIVCFGDSVTGVYYHTGGRRAWSDVLGLALRRLYPASRPTIVNAGVSGNTSGEGLARMDADVLSHRPQLVVAMFGLNDLARGGGPEEFRDHLAQIVARARGAGAEVILMTPNSIYPGDPLRPPLRLAAYAEIVRRVGRDLQVPVADAFGAFEAIRAADPRAWEHLMSETIHPNLRGHEVFAEEVAWTLSGRRCWLEDLPPPRPELPRVLARLRAQEAVRVVAMKPYDGLIGPALQTLFPGARVEVTAWDADHKSLAEIEDQAKALGRFKSGGAPGAGEPDLVVLAVPADAGAAGEEDFYRAYSWIVNWSLPFGPGGWDCLALLPSVTAGPLDPAQRTAESLAREVVRSKDMAWTERAPEDPAAPVDLLTRRLQAALAGPAP